jgi:hypothetical protein
LIRRAAEVDTSGAVSNAWKPALQVLANRLAVSVFVSIHQFQFYRLIKSAVFQLMPGAVSALRRCLNPRCWIFSRMTKRFRLMSVNKNMVEAHVNLNVKGTSWHSYFGLQI